MVIEVKVTDQHGTERIQRVQTSADVHTGTQVEEWIQNHLHLFPDAKAVVPYNTHLVPTFQELRNEAKERAKPF